MRLIDLTFFVELGAAFKDLEVLPDSPTLWSIYFPALRLRSSIGSIILGPNLKLSASLHSANQLVSEINSLENTHFRDRDGKWLSPESEARDDWIVHSITSKAKELRTVLLAELRTVSSFSVDQTGIFNVGQLVNSAHQAMSESSQVRVGTDVRAEIDAAGKCLAFNLPTACGFHAMRAIERIMKMYSAMFFDKSELKKFSNWSHHINALEKLHSQEQLSRPSSEAIALLKQVRDIYRNPLMHPERTLTSEEAATLFHSALAAMSRIAAELVQVEPEIPHLIAA